jgi:hypothetical protein
MGDPVRLTLPIPPSVNRGRFPVVDKARRTVNGIVFDSRKEAVRYSELLLLQRAGEITSLEPQVECKVVINRKHFCTFTVDFYYVDKLRRDQKQWHCQRRRLSPAAQGCGVVPRDSGYGTY